MYVYKFTVAPNTAYASDPLLWQLIHGTWTRPDTSDQFINFRHVIEQGTGTTHYPIIARGDDWLCFDATGLWDNLPPEYLRMPPPTRADFGPPR